MIDAVVEKTKRRSRAKPAVVEIAPDEVAVAGQEAVIEAPLADAVTKPAKPARRRPSKALAAAQAAEAASTPVEAASTPVEAASTPVESAPVELDAAETVAAEPAAEPAPVELASAEPDGPPRKGWWNRTFG